MPDLKILAPANRIPVIREEACMACERCAARRVCKSKAIVQIDPGEAPAIDAARCFGCQACVDACPAGAIESRAW